jgi:effector-binding domain-containing protein
VVLPDLAVSHAPHDEVEVQWKQRLEEPYVYLEGRGSYTGIGGLLERCHGLMVGAGLEASGPPFALFYDDPGVVAVDELRMRACFPVGAGVRPQAPLGADRLPSTTVVYAFIGGPYPEVPRAYPKLFAFLDELGWVLDGPIREIYLVHPARVTDWEELVAEVQLPAAAQR